MRNIIGITRSFSSFTCILEKLTEVYKNWICKGHWHFKNFYSMFFFAKYAEIYPIKILKFWLTNLYQVIFISPSSTFLKIIWRFQVKSLVINHFQLKHSKVGKETPGLANQFHLQEIKSIYSDQGWPNPIINPLREKRFFLKITHFLKICKCDCKGIVLSLRPSTLTCRFWAPTKQTSTQ